MRKHRQATFKVTLLLLVAVLVVGSINRSDCETVSMTLSIGKTTYDVGDTAAIWGNVTANGGLVSDALVAIEVDNSAGTPLILRTRATGTMPSSTLEILSVTPSDVTGNPVNNFTRGTLAYYKISLNNTGTSPQYVEVALNIFDSNNIAFEAFIVFNGLLYNGTTNILVSDPIPLDISSGNATAYVSLLSALPSLGGFAFCPEKSASVLILGNSPPLNQSPEQPLPSSYNLTFLIDDYPTTRPFRAGKYTVNATCKYGNNTTSSSGTFEVVLLGDINGDGAVNILDAILLSDAFLATPSSSNWNPNADLNGDGVVNILDAILLSNNFGRTA